MRDMRCIYKDSNFQKIAKTFLEKVKKNQKCSWSDFKKVFLTLSNDSCPICAKDLDDFDDTDHYRPKSLYKFLECCYENYMVMCSKCNRNLKNDYFPLDKNSIDNLKNENIDIKKFFDNEKYRDEINSRLEREKPLLVNPCKDNIFELFEIRFCFIKKYGGVTLIYPNSNLNKNSYEYRKAICSIRTYKLNNLKISIRLKIMKRTSDKLKNFAIATKIYQQNKNKENFSELIRELSKLHRVDYLEEMDKV